MRTSDENIEGLNFSPTKANLASEKIGSSKVDKKKVFQDVSEMK
jgi:hypothetical protein